LDPNNEASLSKRAYLDALKMLARRDLSEAQVRQRLARKGHEPSAIDAAIGRLLNQRAIDDVRVAESIARRETTVKRHGKLLVRQHIEHAGIAAATARRVVDEVFGPLDADALLETSLERRLRGRKGIADDVEFRRVYRYLVGQGFEPDRVLSALRKYQRSTARPAL
jgi:regulatory protein